MDGAACIDVVGGHGACESLIYVEGCASAFAHPTRVSAMAFEDAKENRPLFAALGQGVARIPLLRLPRRSRGMARHKAHGLDFARPARECVAPGRARNAGLRA